MLAARVRDLPAEEGHSLLLRVATDPARRSTIYELLGGFCHQCRNHLNTLKLSLYLAGRTEGASERGHWTEQEARYRAVEQLFDRLQQICRPMPLTPVCLPIALLWDEVFPRWTERFRSRGIAFEPLPPPAPLVGDFDPTRLGPALEALAEWRANATLPGQFVTFSWKADDHSFLLDWSESQPDAGSALNSSAAATSESFALPFLARVMSAHGGTLEVESGDRFRLRLCWPLKIRSAE
ncbi:MAG: hypothetical protein P4L84_06470 [Isosphaeraceae bacterium]|nr:hypothetical protein [Isosphaeraceae bacterium]